MMVLQTSLHLCDMRDSERETVVSTIIVGTDKSAEGGVCM
jgi:hypothetical protein